MRTNFRFIVTGVWVTIVAALVSIVLATILALFGALGAAVEEQHRVRHQRVLHFVLPRDAADRADLPDLPGAAPDRAESLQDARAHPGVVAAVLPPAPAVFAGILALSLNYGAYMTEIFRAGILAVGPGQTEAADALGMTLPAADAAGRAAAGVQGHHPADRQRVHRHDQGHGAARASSPASCSGTTSSSVRRCRAARLPQPRGVHRDGRRSTGRSRRSSRSSRASWRRRSAGATSGRAVGATEAGQDEVHLRRPRRADVGGGAMMVEIPDPEGDAAGEARRGPRRAPGPTGGGARRAGGAPRRDDLERRAGRPGEGPPQVLRAASRC